MNKTYILRGLTQKAALKNGLGYRKKKVFRSVHRKVWRVWRRKGEHNGTNGNMWEKLIWQELVTYWVLESVRSWRFRWIVIALPGKKSQAEKNRVGQNLGLSILSLKYLRRTHRNVHWESWGYRVGTEVKVLLGSRSWYSCWHRSGEVLSLGRNHPNR